MKTVINCFVIYIVLNNIAFAQSTSFFKTYLSTDKPKEGLKNIIQNSDGSFTVSGDFQSKTVLFKIDSVGDTIWIKKYTQSAQYGITHTFDSGYLIVGNYIIRTNANGDSLWAKAYGGGYGTAVSIKQTNDKGYIICGIKKTDSGIYLPNVLRLDSIGNTQWDKVYSFNRYTDPLSISETFDGNFIIAGDTGQTSCIFLFKVDKNGDSLWTQYFYNNNFSTSCSDIVETTDKGYILSGSKSDGQNSDIYLLKTDIDGNKQWDKSYGGSGNDGASSIIEIADNNYLLTGGFGFSNNFNFIWEYGDAFLLKINANGDSIYMKKYGRGYADNASHLIKSNDGGFGMVGNTFNGTTGKYEGMIIKTDSNGSAPGLILAIPAVFNNNCNGCMENNRLAIFPNPTNESFTIQYSSNKKEELIICNILGETIYKDNWQVGQYQKSIDASTFLSGIYIIRIGNAVQKIVKE